MQRLIRQELAPHSPISRFYISQDKQPLVELIIVIHLNIENRFIPTKHHFYLFYILGSTSDFIFYYYYYFYYLFMYICIYVCMYVCIGCVGSSLLRAGFL